MKFGIFDHIDRRGEPLQKTYQDRLSLIAAADAAGFYCYHLAEHHSTPLGMAPSPSVFLAAVAQHTKRMRLGPMVYVLPLYIPLRLIEEICMLDNLSGGRLDVGIGRGISPFEVGGYGIDPAESRTIMEETLEVLLKGLTEDRLTHHGERYHYDDVGMELRPIQRPHPPLWAGAGSEDSLTFAARHGMNMIALGPDARIKQVTDFYEDSWNTHKNDPKRAHVSAPHPMIGAYRHVVVADTNAEAEKLAQIAFPYWFDSLIKLWRDHDTSPPGAIIKDYDEARRAGQLIAGAPEAVRESLAAQFDTCGHNYAVLQIAFGNLTHEQEMRSLELLASEVLPAFVSSPTS